MTTMFPRLLICEGAEDFFFFQKLIEVRKLQRFHIQSAGGNSRFGAAISRVELEQTSVFNQLADILVVADNDGTPADNFASACKEIEAALGAGKAPREPLKPTKGKPRCTVLMIPWTDEEGDLEGLCSEAARSANANAGTHTDTFLVQMNAAKWAATRKGKAWLRSNLAVRCVDPFVPLGKVFNEKKHETLIPLDHASFKRIADELSKIGKA